MLIFPNSKINLGLNVIEKRPDGYHNIETVFYPLGWSDALEVVENKEGKEPFQMTLTGLPISGDITCNLIYKAWQLISVGSKLPPIKVHLHKIVPMGAGLGGGSSDAAGFLNLANKKFSLGFSEQKLMSMASQLGSDCAFFIKNSPVFASGRGDVFEEVNIKLDQYWILAVYPNLHSNTAEAYSGVVPCRPSLSLKEVISTFSIDQWKDALKNDFEIGIFKKYPKVQLLKEQLYAEGALFAAMSGSGSAVFGIFDKEPSYTPDSTYKYFLQNPAGKLS